MHFNGREFVEGIADAVLRQTVDDGNPQGWIPEQRLSALRKLVGYASGVAYAGFTEDRAGRLAEGYHADIANFDTQLLKADAGKLLGAKVLQTHVGRTLRFGGAACSQIEPMGAAMDNASREKVLKLALRVLGILLIVAASDPPAYRSLISFAAWSRLVPALILVAAVLWYFRPARQ
jgi:hypothetical protein